MPFPLLASENCWKELQDLSLVSAICSCRAFPVWKFLGFPLLLLSIPLHLLTLTSVYSFITQLAEALQSHCSCDTLNNFLATEVCQVLNTKYFWRAGFCCYCSQVSLTLWYHMSITLRVGSVNLYTMQRRSRYTNPRHTGIRTCLHCWKGFVYCTSSLCEMKSKP